MSILLSNHLQSTTASPHPCETVNEPVLEAHPSVEEIPDEPEAIKKPETLVHAMHLAHTLHGSFVGPPDESPDQFTTARDLGVAVSVLRQAHERAKEEPALLEAIRSVARRQGVPGSVRTAIVEVLATCSAESRGDLLTVACSPALAMLNVREQLELVRYMKGPTPRRRRDTSRLKYLDSAWASRRADVVQCVQSLSDVEGLRALLDEPCRDVWLLESTHYRWHSLVMFSEPFSGDGLAYGQRWDITPIGLQARVRSPEHPWCTPDLTGLVYTYKCAMLTRFEELRLVEWIESNFVFCGASKSIHTSNNAVSNNAHTFIDEANHTLTAIMSRRGTPTFMTGTARKPDDP